MKQGLHFGLTILAAIALSGCLTRGFSAYQFRYPTDEQAKAPRIVTVNILGGLGQSLVAPGKKTVDIAIYSHREERILLQEKFKIEGRRFHVVSPVNHETEIIVEIVRKEDNALVARRKYTRTASDGQWVGGNVEKK